MKARAADVLLRGARVAGREALADIAITGGHIVAVGGPAWTAERTIDLHGAFVTSGLVDAHIHLDKAMLTDRVDAPAGTLDEAIRVTADAKRAFTVDDIRARARRVLDMAVRAGTVAMRTHVEVDPIIGLTAMEAVLPLREEYARALDLQICAFPQEGIVKSPGTEGLLRRALSMGADVVGGCPYNDTDGEEHIRIVFALATAFGVDADFHVDFSDEPDHLHIRDIARACIAAGWEGRVTAGHLTELAAVAPHERDYLIALVKDAGIGVIALPATDLYLMGRADEYNVRRGLTPIRHLLEAGVPVALATNNVRNAFTPVGTADLTHMAFIAAVAAHMGTAALLRDLLAAITTHPAAMLRRPEYGLGPGCRADVVAWACDSPEEVVATLPARTLVMKDGRVTVEHEARVRDHWRA